MGSGERGGAGVGSGIVGTVYWPTGFMRQIQVEDLEQNPAAQSEFWERTLWRPLIRGQLEQRGICPVAKGILVYLVKHPWQF